MTIAPTLEIAGASNRVWDVLIVGAGPAGALAARELVRWGLSVLLVDKASFPRWKVCGACFNGRALAVLRAVGLGSLARRLGAVPLRAAWLAARGWQARVPLPDGMSLSRQAFDAALIEEAVHSGANFLPETQAALGPVTAQTRSVLLRQREKQMEVATRLLLVADGLGSGLSDTATRRTVGDRGDAVTQSSPSVAAVTRGAPRRPVAVSRGGRIGAGVVVDEGPAFYARGKITMACGTGGYVGLVRLEDDRLNIAASLDPIILKAWGGPGSAAAALLGEAGLPQVPGLSGASWRGTPALTRQSPQLASNRLFVLGDAAGYIEPFTGEGMGWALTSSQAVVPLAVRAVHRWEPALGNQWTALYRRTVGRRQLACRILASVLRHPRLTRALIGLLSQAPTLATPLVRRFNGSQGSGIRDQS